jgi:FkbM family methyltransferase
VFGANIGLLLADLGDRFPAARLLGVEPDPGNAAVARRYLERFGDRCELVEAAVAEQDGTLTMSWGHGAWGLQRDRDALTEEGVQQVPAREADALLAAHGGEHPIDYLLVNIEGAWLDLLRAGRWTRRVRSITIEVQDHYADVVPMLESLGFRARLEPLRWGAFAVGVRP